MAAPKRACPRAAPEGMGAAIAQVAGVTVVCRERAPRLLALPHVLATVSAFADGSRTWTFLRACDSGSLRLLHRVCSHERSPDARPMDPFYREWQFNRGVETAAARSDLEMVRWLTTVYLPGALVTKGIDAAARNGHLRIVQWLAEERGNAVVDEETMQYAAEGSHIEVAKWLSTRHAEWELMSYANFGKATLDYLQWAVDSGYQWNGSELAAAAGAGRVDVLQWLVGHLDNEYKRWQARSLESDDGPGSTGDDGDGGFLRQFPYKFHTERSQMTLRSETPESLDGLDLPWLRIQRGDWTIESAAMEGHLDVIQWVFENRPGIEPSGAAIDFAARYGHLDIVKWFYSNRAEGSAEETIGMDRAAAHGHLDVVRWLHDNRSEGCSTFAMDSAARGGHLAVVEFLHANRSEGCTVAAMD